jgi:hypothetical protein
MYNIYRFLSSVSWTQFLDKGWLPSSLQWKNGWNCGEMVGKKNDKQLDSMQQISEENMTPNARLCTKGDLVCTMMYEEEQPRLKFPTRKKMLAYICNYSGVTSVTCSVGGGVSYKTVKLPTRGLPQVNTDVIKVTPLWRQTCSIYPHCMLKGFLANHFKRNTLLLTVRGGQWR